MMKIGLIFFSAMLCLVLSPSMHAEGVIEASILFKSNSEKTISIDRGDLDQFEEGSFGKIYIQRGKLDYPTIFLVAEGRIVKSYPKKSIWVLEKNYLKNLIKNGEPVLIMLDKFVTKGRPTKIRTRSIVYNKDEYDSADSFIEQNKNNVPQKFIKHLDEYEASDNIFSESTLPDKDVEVSSYSTFNRGGNTKFNDEYNDEINAKAVEINKNFKIGDVRKAEDRKLLDSESELFIKKYNSQRFGLTNGLYHEQKKEPGSHEINKKITVDSVYDEEKAIERARQIIDPRAIAKLKRDGQMWSGDMDDDALRRYFVTTGLLREKYRKDVISHESDGHEFMFSYAGNLAGHAVSTDIDPNNQMLGYHFNLAYDLHLSRTTVESKKLSIQFLVERGLNYYNVNNINGRSEEGLYGAYLNYYFINNPLTINHFIWEAGLGIKTGTSIMTSSKLTTDYSYQVLVLPAIQVLTKYRFQNSELNEDSMNVGMSVNSGILYECKQLRLVNSTGDNISRVVKVNDIKYQLGLSFYF